MGTKNNPGRFDCYESADPDEPMFVLLGRDAFAADMVRLWAALRLGDAPEAAKFFYELMQTAWDKMTPDAELDKAYEANKCADAMDEWWENTKNGGLPRSRVVRE